jgi:hypothetical protein
MKSSHLKTIGGIAVFLSALVAAELVGQAQNPKPQNAAAPAIAATREQIWNSPNMLRARAWLQEYCERSAKISPAEKQAYMTELQNLSPTQMKLWLLKFDQEEEARQQQQAFFEQTRSAALGRAKSADAATQKTYAAINQGETAAANNAEQQFNTQSANEQNAAENKAIENVGAADTYGPNGYRSYGGIHYHYHFYPY